jgi:hypothetical protein
MQIFKSKAQVYCAFFITMVIKKEYHLNMMNQEKTEKKGKGIKARGNPFLIHPL